MNVLIVESAAKGRTLKRYLAEDWEVVATGGHVETLPDDRKKYGKEAKKAYWANRPGELPTPPWVWTDRGEKAVERILAAGGEHPVFWIATDPDREGEFIAWCLDRLLSDHGPTHRVAFQEVTEEAVKEAIEHPRRVDQGMVDSALVRKFLDRLVGFRTSKMASAIVGRGASMGRVQTPTLGFVVERELEREAFVPTPYFEVRARAEGQAMQVRFHGRGDPERWRDAAGNTSLVRTFDGAAAQQAFDALSSAGRVTLARIQERTPRPRKPQPPFSTDTLLQDGGSRLGWSPRKTSALASMLYEAGHITYIRTDSTRLAAQAVTAARGIVKADFGEEYLGPEAKGNVASGPSQDAHEAIRPTRLQVPEVGLEDEDARRLYRLIRARTLASQMAPSTSAARDVEATCAGLDRPLTGTLSWRTFLGWEAAYREFEPQRPTAPPDVPLAEGAVWTLDPGREGEPNPELVEDETRPPARYRAHTLIKAMKDAGIGRPSTYSRTVDKLEERGYVQEEDGAVAPTVRGRAVWLDAAPLYARGAEHEDRAELFSPEFTATMETGLDQVAAGEVQAPERWEAWRDRVRDLHEAARERRNAGGSTPKQHQMLGRLLANLTDASDVGPIPEDLEGLSYRDAQDLTARLRQAGVEPAPSPAQLDYVDTLLEDLALDEEELGDILGEGGIESIRTTSQASRILDVLSALYEERRPPSAKQRKFIEGLLKETGTSEAEAAELVGVPSLDELTGGSEGTASALIDELEARKKATAGAPA
ncbi:MAG: type IA DNA topoisomerase [Gemmatimonadales bacterium]|nr:MAG: type IA DNA topoisomerase [Gemmatimonadales bacterium]